MMELARIIRESIDDALFTHRAAHRLFVAGSVDHDLQPGQVVSVTKHTRLIPLVPDPKAGNCEGCGAPGRAGTCRYCGRLR